MNSETGQIKQLEEITKGMSTKEQEKEVKKPQWTQFGVGDPVMLYDRHGTLIGYFKVSKMNSRSRVSIKGIPKELFADMYRRKEIE